MNTGKLRAKTINEAIDTINEEIIFDLLTEGVVEKGAARFLATHPHTLRQWRDDKDDFTRLLKSSTR